MTGVIELLFFRPGYWPLTSIAFAGIPARVSVAAVFFAVWSAGMPTSVGYLSITTIHWPRLNFGEIGPVFTCGVVFSAFAFGAVVEAGGCRSAFEAVPLA